MKQNNEKRKRIILSLSMIIASLIIASFLAGCNQTSKLNSWHYGNDTQGTIYHHKVSDTAHTIIFIGNEKKSDDATKKQHSTEHIKNYFTIKGYNFVTMDYTSDDEELVSSKAEKIAKGIAQILNLDIKKTHGRNVYVIGYEQGAYLASLALSDKKNLEKEGFDADDIRGAIFIEGLYYENRSLELEDKNKNYNEQTSALYHISQNNTFPQALIVYIDKRGEKKDHATMFYNQLKRSGHSPELVPLFGLTPKEIYERIGSEHDTTTEYIIDFIRRHNY